MVDKNRFEIEHEHRKDISIFHLKGSLTMNVVPIFTSYVNKNKERLNIALEFGEVDFIDSSGIGSIINILTNLKSTNGKLICYNLTDDIFSIFKMAKLNSFLQIITKREFNRKYPRVESFEDIMKNRNDEN